MENATDALLMAGSVLLLIIALTVSISSFTNLKLQVDEYLRYRDQIEETKAGEEYLQFIKSGKDARTVGIETVITAIRRIRKEQYVMYICFNNTGLSNQIEKNIEPIKSVVDDETIINKQNNLLNIDSIKGKEVLKAENIDTVLKFTLDDAGWKYIEDNNILAKLYNSLNGTEFNEYIGVYQNKAEGVSSANKTTFKVITFVQVQE